MNLTKQVLEHDVYLSLGCTEPTAVAFTASAAGKEADDEIRSISITVDPGVFKNGFAVMVPNTDGQCGNLIAGVLGALIARPDLKMEILKEANSESAAKAKRMIDENSAVLSCDHSKNELYIEVRIETATGTVRAVTERQHTNLLLVEKNGTVVFRKAEDHDSRISIDYETVLKTMQIIDLVDLAENLDSADYDYVKSGVEVNLAASRAGRELRKVGHYLYELVKKGYLLEDVFASTKILTASATDARMAGMSCAVMSSGGSGNQGIVAILVPWNVGNHLKVDEEKIVRSIALSHLINSYIKCHTGHLSPICGCAIAAGVGAAAAIVYQVAGKEMQKIGLAVNNLISDLGGMLCDGAKGGCALKVVSSTESAIRSAFMALNDYGIASIEGFVGGTAEETIRNLSRISEIGMARVDDTMIKIMAEKPHGVICR
ncbi:MAG: serine dehydratase subunit alpha family protein [Deltaproteobacteria bacterium HGW-Deltaproteobacteria-21]|nr:MAG: serine dehydratase subunit alpha family protein [Deltaproteobacteria bacterium HGW-Deltaproteobacteria-21]